jgi:hypothetical protein
VGVSYLNLSQFYNRVIPPDCWTIVLLSRDRVAFEKCNRKLGRSDPVNDLLALIEVESSHDSSSGCVQLDHFTLSSMMPETIYRVTIRTLRQAEVGACYDPGV